MNKSILSLAALVVAFAVGCEPPAQPNVSTSTDTTAPAADSNTTGSDSNVTTGVDTPAVETPAAEAPAAEAPAAEAPAKE
ncbi:hypothetical protein OAF37_01910 [Rubripirellula sp.]|nr:hypothetical protein [Rubripirellula sp.]MDB4644791.1 hypothetical protein [Rubripirellula sp.]